MVSRLAANDQVSDRLPLEKLESVARRGSGGPGYRWPMVCPECATPNPDGARFCSSCGAPLEGASSVDCVTRLESYLPKGMLAKLETARDPLVHPLLGLREPAGALTIGAGEDWLAGPSRTVSDSSVNSRSSSALDEKEFRWPDRR